MRRNVVIALNVLLAGIGTAHAGSYRYTTIDPPGSSDTEVFGVNNHDQVAGFGRTTGPGASTKAFVWTNGTFGYASARSPKKQPGLFDINDSGVAVGRDSIANAIQGDGIVFRGADATTRFPVKPASGFSNSTLFAVNDHNVFVGDASSTGPTHLPDTGILVSGGVVHPVTGLPAGATSSLFGINNAGESYGSFRAAGGGGYFTYAAGQVTMVEFPANISDQIVTSLGQDGTLTGYYRNAALATRGFVDANGSFQEVSYPGAGSTKVYASNAQGVFGTFSATPRLGERPFVLHAGAYTAIRVPIAGALNFKMQSVAANGSFVGTYQDVNGFTHGYIASCAANQRPCTR